MKKFSLVALSLLIFLYFEKARTGIFGFFDDEKELAINAETIQSLKIESNFLNTTEFDSIYKNLPEMRMSTRDFAFRTANPEFQRIFQSHLNRIKLINCRNLFKNNIDQSKCIPEISITELYSGPTALKLAQSGKKVVVLIFADSTNVGGIYLTKSDNPAGTQEEQTVLMAPEIYGHLGNNFGVNDIGGYGDGIYSANQKRYCLDKDGYGENSEFINPAYGFILTNLLVTHDVEKCSEIIKLPKDKVAEISYAFLSMPSFAIDVSKDPTGAMLINYSGEKDGKNIYEKMKQAFSILMTDKEIRKSFLDNNVMRDIGKIAIFYPEEKLRNFSKQYLGENLCTSEIIAKIIVIKSEQQEKVELRKKVMGIFDEAQKNYEKCVFDKFVNLIRGAEIAEADTLVLGKIGCGAFLNDENEIAKIMGKALEKCRSIKHVWFAGLNKTDPFVEKVKVAM